MCNMVKCVVCGDKCDPENPFDTGAIYTHNPKTNRLAWICGFCLEVEWDELTPEQKDEYRLLEEK